MLEIAVLNVSATLFAVGREMEEAQLRVILIILGPV
jgi:hypothetical protein